MLKQRVITAVLLIPIIVAAVLFMPSQWFAGLTLLFLLVGVWEWAGLTGFKRSVAGPLFIILTLIMLGLGVAYASDHQIELMLRATGLWWVIALVWVVLVDRGRLRADAPPLIRSFAGILVLIPTWVGLVIMQNISVKGPWLVLGIMIVVWAADIGAYFSGRQFGRHKLAPVLSPKKTWEGVAGGLVAAALLAALMAGIAGYKGSVLAMIVGVAMMLGIVSVIGDLFESMMKRMAGVKDSGAILPGHGGVLDRIDSLTAAVPTAALAWWIFGDLL